MAKRGAKIITAILLTVTLLSTTITALAVQVNFRNSNNGNIYTFDSAGSSYRVGWGRTNHYRNVSLIQAAHNSYGSFPVIAIDGNFGGNTEAAIKRLQALYNSSSNPVAIDGDAGDVTWRNVHNARGYYNTGWSLPFMYP